jgi:hypothetical protein
MTRRNTQLYKQQRERWDLVLTRLPLEDGRQLREYARRKNISVAEAIRECVTWRLEELGLE